MKRLLLAFLVVGLSCGGHDDDGPTDMSPQGVCAYSADKDCAGYERCDPYTLREYFNDGATCRERLALGCVSRLTAAGTNDTPARVVSCAKAIAPLSCESYLDTDRWPESCSLLPGTLQDGAGCTASAQCKGNDCVIGSRQACGVCKTLPREGESCAGTGECLNFIPCVNDVCTLPPRLGEPCIDGVLWCVYGLACRNLDAAGMGTCDHYLPTGATCDPNSDTCDFVNGDQCDFSTSACTHSLGSSRRAGESCNNADLSCNSATFCSEGVCKLRPREGQPCAFDQTGSTVCLTPARCIDGVCAVRDASVCR